MEKFKNESTYKGFVEAGNEEEFDNLFDGAVEEAISGFGKRNPMYINGEESYAASEIEERSPIDGTIIGRFQKGSRDDAIKAIAAAEAAFKEWSDVSYKERVRIMKGAALLFSKYKFYIAAVLSIENGKTRYESIGEVDEAIDFLNYYSIEMEKRKGYLRRSEIAGSSASVSAGFQGAPGKTEKVRIAMKPYGVFGVIAPFNFPISISTGMSAAALITGNTVVFKPSSTDNMTMLTGLKIYEIFNEAGLPHGVFNYITGSGSEVGDELVTNKRVRGIAFTGSKRTGMGMISKNYAAGLQKVFVVEMGGKNPCIVSRYADLDEAAYGVASAAFGYSGQKCSACSRVYVNESVKEEFISRLLSVTKEMKIGNPLKKENYIGPLISASALERFKASTALAKNDGRVVCGGNILETTKGIYVEPTIVEANHASMLFHEELFLPFLVIDEYRAFDEAIDKANDSEYGLTAGLYSKNKAEIKRFISGMQAGVLYVNRRISATTGAIVGFHTFVGWKGSGITGKGTGSSFYLEQFMREQSQSVVG